MSRAYLTVLVFQGIAAVAALAALRWLGAYVSPEVFGTYTLYMSVVSASALLLVSWPNAALLRFGREEWTRDGHVGRTLGTRLALFGASLAVALLLAASLSTPLQRFLGVDRSPVPWIMAGVVAAAVSDLAVYLSQAVGRAEVYGYSPAVTRVGFFVAVVAIPLLSFEPHWTYLAGWWAASAFAASLVSVAILPRATWRAVSIDGPTLTRILRYSWTLPFAGLSTYVVSWIDTWVIRGARGVGAVGVYGWAYQVTSLASLAFAPVAVILTPRAIDARVHQDETRLNAYAAAIAPTIAIVTVVLAAGLALLYPVLHAVAAPAYYAAYPSMLLLIAAIPFQLTSYLITPLGNAHERCLPRFVMASVLIAVLNTLGDLLLVPRMGPAGAALSTTTAFAIGSIVQVIVVRAERIRFPALWRFALPAALLAPSIGALVVLGPSAGAVVIAIGVCCTFGLSARRLGAGGAVGNGPWLSPDVIATLGRALAMHSSVTPDATDEGSV